MSNAIGNIGLAIILSLAVIGCVNLMSTYMIEYLGWHLLTVMYLLIVLSLIFHYYKTSYHKPIWIVVISFIINFVVWVTEQVNIESMFQASWLYNDNKVGAFMLGGLLWAINKFVIDFIYLKITAIQKAQ